MGNCDGIGGFGKRSIVLDAGLKEVWSEIVSERVDDTDTEDHVISLSPMSVISSNENDRPRDVDVTAVVMRLAARGKVPEGIIEEEDSEGKVPVRWSSGCSDSSTGDIAMSERVVEIWKNVGLSLAEGHQHP